VRIGRGICLPGGGSNLQLLGCDLLAFRKQRSQLVGIEFAQAAKVRFARKFAHANQAESCLAQFLLSKPIEQVDQMDLAEEIVLKPKHYFIVLWKRRQLRFLVQ
jgi:hypothetical protein